MEFEDTTVVPGAKHEMEAKSSRIMTYFACFYKICIVKNFLEATWVSNTKWFSFSTNNKVGLFLGIPVESGSWSNLGVIATQSSHPVIA